MRIEYMEDILPNLLKRTILNIAEYHLLTIIYRDGTTDRNNLARYILDYFSAASPTQVQTIVQYEKAIDACLEWNLIKTLSVSDCEEDRQRWSRDENQNLDEAPYYPGNLDFTLLGAELYGDILKKLSGKSGQDITSLTKHPEAGQKNTGR